MGLQEPSWPSSLLGLACAWAAHQDYRAARENCWCVEEAITCLLFLYVVYGSLSEIEIDPFSATVITCRWLICTFQSLFQSDVVLLYAHAWDFG
jgi:hypothetical protein